ncbi:LacI family DNA-binding transcriptional regulator [Alloscardovia criceti]|uniref:LacI family DNA-binding transcriptional regulator n=1 Tax=Alloscardovia criceti TaxID=356828 RepID=UPI00037719F9|nr:LacI family DNA-binding transcriptional regulator [Alloscardovia criceti]
MGENKVSIIDVAKAAGVSYQTVSRVINNSPSVRQSTRRKVMEAIEKLDYHPSLSAQSLKTQRTRMIGVIASQAQYSGPLLTIAAIESMARSRNLFVSVATVDESRLNPTDFSQIEESFVKLGVEAVVIVAPTEAMVTLAVESRVHVPRVIITAAEGIQDLQSRQFDARCVKFVSTDQDQASEQIVQALIAGGITRIYYLDGPQQWRDAYTRRVAAQRASMRANVNFELVEINDWDSITAYEKMSSFLRTHGADCVKDCALWGANDLLAMGAQRAVIEAELSVPQDVCIVGYDNMPGTESLIPPLTTVDPNYAQVGLLAMRLVLDMLKYEELDKDEETQSFQRFPGMDNVFMIEPSVILRNSTR